MEKVIVEETTPGRYRAGVQRGIVFHFFDIPGEIRTRADFEHWFRGRIPASKKGIEYTISFPAMMPGECRRGKDG